MSDAFDCAEVHIVEHDVEDMVLEGLRAQAALAVELSHVWEERRGKAQRSVAATAKALAALKEKHSRQAQGIKDLYESLFAGEISKAEYLAMKGAALKECDAIAAQIARMEAGIENWGADGTLQNRFVDSFKQYAEVQELTKEIVGEVLDSVYVYPGGQVEIVWNFSDELKKLVLDLQGGEQDGR